MWIDSSCDVSDVHDKRTLIGVLLDDGREVDVMHKPDTGLMYVMEPCDNVTEAEETEIVAFVKKGICPNKEAT